MNANDFRARLYPGRGEFNALACPPRLAKSGTAGHAPAMSTPDTPEHIDEELDEALEESFPASDPPSMTQPHGGEDEDPTEGEDGKGI